MAKRTEMEKQIFPREFVIWIGFMSSRLIYREIDNHWLLVKNIDKINDWTSYTLDELYKYWRLEIEPKNKEK